MISLFAAFACCISADTLGHLSFSMEPVQEEHCLAVQLKPEFLTTFLFTSRHQGRVITIKIDGTEYQKFSNNAIMVQGTKVELCNKNAFPVSVDIWTTNESLCEDNAVLVYTPNGARWSTQIINAKKNFCIFTLSTGRSSTYVTVNPKDSAEVRFFTPIQASDQMHTEPATSLDTYEIFFAAVKPKLGANVDFEFSYWGTMKDTTEDTCVIEPVVFGTSGGLEANHSWGGKISGRQCSASSNLLADRTVFLTVAVVLGVGGCSIAVFIVCMFRKSKRGFRGGESDVGMYLVDAPARNIAGTDYLDEDEMETPKFI